MHCGRQILCFPLLFDKSLPAEETDCGRTANAFSGEVASAELTRSQIPEKKPARHSELRTWLQRDLLQGMSEWLSEGLSVEFLIRMRSPAPSTVPQDLALLCLTPHPCRLQFDITGDLQTSISTVEPKLLTRAAIVAPLWPWPAPEHSVC